jgi:pimeloyl-ACP methyl ester carboxylesterase
LIFLICFAHDNTDSVRFTILAAGKAGIQEYMSYCTINGHNIHYKIIPAGTEESRLPWLIFLHEGLGSIAQWKDFPEEMSGRLQLPALVYDRYGHGKSDGLKEKRSSDFLKIAAQKELPALLEALKIQSPLLLIGHSDGANVALHFAAEFPQRTLAVVSEAAHVMLEDVSRSGIRNTEKLFQETNFRDYLARYHDQHTDNMFYGWAHTWLHEIEDGWSMQDDLSRITCPVLAIQGEDDEYGSFAQLAYIKQHCTGATELLFIPDCGHNPHFQQREAVVNNIAEFIRKHVTLLSQK